MRIYVWTFLDWHNILTFVINKSEKEVKRILYKKWHAAKDRCHNINNRQYKDYGERGIVMSNEWKDNFMCFYVDMVGSYKTNLTLDRINNNKGYCKENCRWATWKVQASNRRKSVKNNPLKLIGGKSISRRFPLTFKNKEYFFDSNQERMSFFNNFLIDIATI